MSDQRDEPFVPSLLSAVRRYWFAVGAVLVVAAIVGIAFAGRTYQPTVEIRIGVDAVAGPSAGASSQVDARRLTAEVAAAIDSPAVLDRVRADTGVTDLDVSTSFEEISSILTARVTAGTIDGATRVADGLVKSYNDLKAADAQAALTAQLVPIDQALAALRRERDAVATELRAIGATPGSPATTASNTGLLAELNTRYSSLVARIAAYESERDGIVRSGVRDDYKVYPAGAPYVTRTQTALTTRYVPAAVVAAGLLSLVLLAAVARRRPWITNADQVIAAFGAPALGVVNTRREANEVLKAAGRVGAIAVEQALDQTGASLVVVARVGAAGRTRHRVGRVLAFDLARSLDARGIKAAVAEVAGDRATLLRADGSEIETRSRRGRLPAVQLAVWLQPTELDCDVVIAVAAPTLDSDTAFDLLAASDAAVVTIAWGTSLADVERTRGDLVAVDRKPIGLVLHR
ncbi:MAG: hypothetical protein AB7L13_21090 [Acidimicrobiia bacterium]